MRVKNLGNLLNEIKPLLRQYLEDYGTEFTRTHFQCPNRGRHSADDTKVACNFYPDESHFKCFVCNESGDIFNACHLLEGRPAAGKGFIRDNVLYLADKYDIPYDLEEESEEEKAYNKARKFVEQLIDNGHKYLKEKKPKIAMSYLKERDWTKIVNTHKIGYLPDNPTMQAAFKKLYKNKYATYINISYKSVVNRLLYPMYNAHGIVIGLSTRVLVKDDKSQKYKHHPLKLTKKPINILYNLNNARKFSKLYLVEGASSIFTLSKNGIDSAVAIMGSNFVEKHYEWLLKNDIKQLVLCFDGDKPGLNALADTIKIIQAKSGIKIYVKKLEDDLDPDDYIKKNGVAKFIELEETPLFLYQLKNYIDTEETKYRDSLFALLLAEEDGVKREKLLNILTKKTKILKTTLIKELEKYENKHSLMSGISTAAYLEEGVILEKEVDKFDELRWNTDELIGLKTGHPIFDEQMDGLQIGLHMVGGRWNVGKSAFCLDLAIRLIQNPNNYVLYFSIDDPSIFKTIPRMVANLSKENVNAVAKPIYAIEKNETLSEDLKVDMSANIEDAINLVRSYSNRFSLKDAKYGQDLQFILQTIRLCKQRALDSGNKNLIVFIDFLHMIKVKGDQETEKLIEISKELKRATSIYECPIVTTVMGTKSGMEAKNLKDDSIKGAVELQYEADTINLLETDFYDDKGKMFFYDDEGISRPVISFHVSKNKVMSPFKGKLFYKFYGEQMRFEECDEDEQKKYRKVSGSGGY